MKGVTVGVYGLALFGMVGGAIWGLGYSRLLREADGKAMWWAVNAVRVAEARFKDGDLDGNGVADYWTGDLASLLAPFLAMPGTPLGPETAALARADVAPLLLGKAPIPFHGYYVTVVRLDEDGGPLQRDTDGSGALTHHLEEFALCFYPAVYDPAAGKVDTWFITRSGRFKSDTGGKPVLRWPDLRMWGRCC